jgi:hypothetical protein
VVEIMDNPNLERDLRICWWVFVALEVLAGTAGGIICGLSIPGGGAFAVLVLAVIGATLGWFLGRLLATPIAALGTLLEGQARLTRRIGDLSHQTGRLKPGMAEDDGQELVRLTQAIGIAVAEVRKAVLKRSE